MRAKANSEKLDCCLDCRLCREKVSLGGRVRFYCARNAKRLASKQLWGAPCRHFVPY